MIKYFTLIVLFIGISGKNFLIETEDHVDEESISSGGNRIRFENRLRNSGQDAQVFLSKIKNSLASGQLKDLDIEDPLKWFDDFKEAYELYEQGKLKEIDIGDPQLFLERLGEELDKMNGEDYSSGIRKQDVFERTLKNLEKNQRKQSLSDMIKYLSKGIGR